MSKGKEEFFTICPDCKHIEALSDFKAGQGCVNCGRAPYSQHVEYDTQESAHVRKGEAKSKPARSMNNKK